MEQSAASPNLRILAHWPEDHVWFRDRIPDELPWGDDSLLDDIPGSAKGSYGVRVADPVKFDGERYNKGDLVLADDRRDFARLLSGIGEVDGIVVPWYGKIIPPALAVPHTRTISLENYRSGLRGLFLKALGISVAAVAFGYYKPEFLMIALLAGAFYGLFPLVETAMAWCRRVDRLSVDDLNRRTASGLLFSLWMKERPTGILRIALVVLVLVYAGQWYVDVDDSVARAALVKTAVLENGEWWRTVTSGLMHGGWLHILFNGMALYSLGRVIVALVSPSLLTIVFLATVITGSLASLWLGQAPASVGASGGLLGCLGFLLVVCRKFKAVLPAYLQRSCVQATIVMTIFGFLGARFIDNAAHAGGFVGGLLLGAIFYKGMRLASKETTFPVKVLSWASVAVLVAATGKIALELWTLHSGA